MEATKPRLKASDFRVLDDVFQMGGGFVLDFSNPTFSQFFDDEIGINIDAPQYSVEGTSKAKRLRYFLRVSDPKTVLATLTALWEYKVATENLSEDHELAPNVHAAFRKLVERFGGQLRDDSQKPESKAVTENISEAVSKALSDRLIEVSSMPAQRRGYAYESFLKEVFDAYGLAGKPSFRLRGEQIDGSFQYCQETYLLEAKWQNEPVGAADLHTFHGKLGEKAAWSRGLFVSNSGFSADGLHAFGRGKRVVCMDGFDFSEMLRRRISFSDVISAKVRTAAETGNPHVSVRELFP